uniref:Putative conserved plasma membrane protein n=1 Tax=Tabanus bromius TaxID=304241 RepID=A0A0K8TPI7_TABBR
MLAKQILFRPAFIKNCAALTRTYHGGHHKVATMNDLPVPQGDWQEHYQKLQSKYNAILATGVVMLLAAVGLAKSTGVIRFNYSPPKSLD